MWMPDVPHDAHRSQDHRQTEDLCHERLRGAPQKQDAQGDTNDGDDPHERAETERCGPGMAEVSVLPESHELERNRGQGAEGPCEDRWHAEQEDEGRNSVPAPRHTAPAQAEPKPQAQYKAEAAPTPVKPERTPIGSAKRLPTARPSRPSARVPEGASKESSRRIGAPSTFPEPPLYSSQQASQPNQSNSESGRSPRRLSFGRRHLHAVRSRRTDRMRPRSTEIEPRYRRARFFVRNWTWTSEPADSICSSAIASGSRYGSKDLAIAPIPRDSFHASSRRTTSVATKSSASTIRPRARDS